MGLCDGPAGPALSFFGISSGLLTLLLSMRLGIIAIDTFQGNTMTVYRV